MPMFNNPNIYFSDISRSCQIQFVFIYIQDVLCCCEDQQNYNQYETSSLPGHDFWVMRYIKLI